MNLSKITTDNNIPTDDTDIFKINKNLKKIQPFTIYLNSKNRITGNSSNFSYLINLPKDNNYTKCIITNAIIPKTFYNVQSPYNRFTLYENGTSVNVYLTEANYTENSLRLEIQTALNANSPFGFTYSVSFPNSRTEPQTGKYTFTRVVGAGTIRFIFTSSSCYEQLGFDSDSTNEFEGGSLTSTNVIYLGGERTIFIHSNLVSNTNDNILQEIYSNITAPFTSILFQQLEYNLNAKPFIGHNSNVFYFRLTDENDVELSLNNSDFNFTLKFW